MKTRSKRAESTSKGQGRLFQNCWRSPCQNGHVRRQAVQQCNNSQAVLKDSQVSAKLHVNSQVDYLKENCISLSDVPSPIIGSRRRALGPRNVCRDLGFLSQECKKENISPPKKVDSNQTDKVFPLQDSANTNTSKKDKGTAKDVKKQSTTTEKNVISDKENILSSCSVQIPLRQSKRIQVAKRNKDPQDAPKKAPQNLFDRKQTEATSTKHLKNRVQPRDISSKSKQNLISPCDKAHTAEQVSILEDEGHKTCKDSSVLSRRTSKRATPRSLAKEDSNTCDKAHTAEQVSISEDEGHKTCKDSSVLSKRTSKRATPRSLAKEDSNTCDKTHAAEQVSISEDEGHNTCKDSSVLSKRTSKRATPKSLAKEDSNTCDKTHSAGQVSISENGAHKVCKDSSVLSRRTSKRATPKSVAKEDNVDKCDEASKRIGRQGKVKAKTATPNMKESSNSLESKGKAETKSKQPVWASVRGIRITPGKRKSLRISKDTYEFTGSPTKEKKEVKKRKKKPRKLVKKLKSCTKLTLLTTDPSWQGAASKGMPLLGASLACSTTTAADSPGCLEDSMDDMGEGASIPSVMSSIRAEDATHEELSLMANFEGFENVGFDGETRSSFVMPNRCNDNLIRDGSASVLPTPTASNGKSKFAGNSSTPRIENALQAEAPKSVSVPMTSANVLPTPAVSKRITKFIGGSSTPRTENTMEAAANQEPEAANDSLAQCFGFTDEPEESELNISPVQRSRLRNSLEITGTSDVMDGELHPASLPSRFSWSSLRPGNRSRTSFTSRSSSMVAQGRSVSRVMDTSSRSAQPTLSSFLVPTVGKKHRRPQRKKDLTDGEVGIASTGTESINREKETDVSVLFDEKELAEELSGGKEVSEASQRGSAPPPLPANPTAEGAANSPQKNFQKAPRKSYNRASLLSAKRKFVETYGGYAGSDSNTEEEESDTEFKLKVSKKTKKPSKKPAKGKEKSPKKVSSTTSKKKKGGNDNDPSLDEWASRLNSHFSEVEESILMVE